MKKKKIILCHYTNLNLKFINKNNKKKNDAIFRLKKKKY